MGGTDKLSYGPHGTSAFPQGIPCRKGHRFKLFPQMKLMIP